MQWRCMQTSGQSWPVNFCSLGQHLNGGAAMMTCTCCVLSCCSIQAFGSLGVNSLHFTFHSILADGWTDEELQQQKLWT